MGPRHSSFVMISPLATPSLCQGYGFTSNMPGHPSSTT